jgi:hypothetical protein
MVDATRFRTRRNAWTRGVETRPAIWSTDPVSLGDLAPGISKGRYMSESTGELGMLISGDGGDVEVSEDSDDKAVLPRCKCRRPVRWDHRGKRTS